MNNKQENFDVIYRPIPFIIGSFMITWSCAGLMLKIDYDAHVILFSFLDFLENASPLFCALLLLRPYWTREKWLFQFFVGVSAPMPQYVIVFALFAAQFLNFWLFKVESTDFSVQTFMITFAEQLMFGGGLEEGGWRGYLLPCLYKKYPVLFSSIMVSVVWVLWHLPYFFISGSLQAGESFLSYSIIGIMTGFILTAIYLLTKSVFLCMLFHSWQNTIVMTVQTDTSNIWFMVIFLFLGITSAFLCLIRQKPGILRALHMM